MLGNTLTSACPTHATTQICPTCASTARKRSSSHCILDYPVQPGVLYNFSLRLSGSNASGAFWTGTVMDTATKKEALVGTLFMPSVGGALGAYSRKRVIRTSIVQGFAQLGSDLLVDFDLMMTIPLLGPFFLTMTQLSMPWVLRFLYTPEF